MTTTADQHVEHITMQDDKYEGLEPISVRIAMAVKLTGIGRSTLYELIGSGEIETVKVGRSTLIPYRSLKRLILR